MFDADRLFKERLSHYMKETGRYLRYIFNGHIAVALFFFIAAFAYFYQQWLLTIPESFPSTIIMATVFGILVSLGSVRTLLQEADLVFLVPAEKKMRRYFKKTVLLSYFIGWYPIFLVAALFGPLYFASFPERSGRTYLLLIVVLLIFKGWNLLATWWMNNIQDKTIRVIDLFTRLLVSTAVFYFLIDGTMILATICTGLFIGVFLYDLFISRKQPNINWYLLIEKDQNRMQAFYRMANLFTDVPHLRNPVKKRNWLVSLWAHRVPYKQRLTYDYLFRLTFIRSGDYLSMYIRLIIVGSLFIYFVPIVWVKVLFAILFLYMSLFQMMTIYRHHRVNIWLDIYPISEENRKQALLRLIIKLGLLQTVIFTIVTLFLQNYFLTGIMFIVGVIFSYGFVYFYMKEKLVS
ncbi:ABC-2 type transport system permease protein [Cerasibacillus quisquiliarum]|uniref:ABC transporter permease n=1 Tax=Cerasibacillus quisquiliarum TaxID=227865 RepID=A0A511V057_9BACI|nr:ABC transporter permease [Cerasibacillus quisquiliarum]MBB5146395.1 ABC-2 type transport system permease protein [Cerasibacillus quisquiliarum]GEN30722.1 ABC transporter permease [Cerasibacillus quisquiliarum]